MQLERKCLARARKQEQILQRKYGTCPRRNRQFAEQIGNPKVTPTLIFNLKSSRNDTKQIKNSEFIVPFFK